MTESLRAKHVVPIANVATLADGLAGQIDRNAVFLGRLGKRMSVRDTEATSTLGQLEALLEEVRAAQDNYVVLIESSCDIADQWRRQADSAAAGAKPCSRTSSTSASK